ncbi:MAG: hypothetical protein LBS30_06830 [Planctomycetota bacterium]|jgi:hypothetical protein|nr:hypothetical protein [Planctomycetota bacterium]
MAAPSRISSFIRALAITFGIGIVAVGALRFFGVIGDSRNPNDPAELIRQATESLEAVRLRTPADRRPASFDSVLTPLDNILAQSRDLLRSDAYDPVNDYEKLRELTIPVIHIATQADSLARAETGMWTKEYRFNSQKAEACQYLANALWERINRQAPSQDGFFAADAPAYPLADMVELRRILDTGVQADPENTELLYARGILNRAEGLFAPAAKDFDQALSIRNEFPGAWNTLGLTRIALKEFDKAEEAFERAREQVLGQAEKLGQDPGTEYSAILYNLAMFHENLAAYYARENRMAPTVEYQRLLARHADGARRYLEEFLQHEPAESPDAEIARTKLRALGQ